MSKADEHGSPHRRPHAPPMASPFLEFDLMREIHQLHEEPGWHSGQNARTLVKYADLRVVLMVLKANARLPEHSTDGRISLQILSGRIEVRALGRTFDLHAGSLLALDRDTHHDIEAIDDSVLLLTIAWPGGLAP